MTAGSGFEVREQGIRPVARLRGLRYVPLVMLVVVALVLTVVGFFVQRSLQAQWAEEAAPVALPAEVGATSLAASCTPEVVQPEAQPWLSGDPDAVAAATAEWDAHAGEIAQPWIQGQDGMVFWSDVQAMNMSQAVGRRVLSQAEIDTWASFLSTLEADLAADDVALFVSIAPAKWDVYPELLPEWMQEIRGSGPLDQMLAVHPELPWIDVRQTLRDANATAPTFADTNSHWTDYGAAVAWQQMATCMAESDPAMAALAPPTIVDVEQQDPSNEFATYGVPDSDDFVGPVLGETLGDVELTSGASTQTVAGDAYVGLEALPASTRNDAAQLDMTALILRDSMGTALAPYWQDAFAETVQARHNVDAPADIPDIGALVDEHAPQVVILEIAERHLTFPPPAQP
ncbi:hypothetical protein GCM10009846_06580 [Agrococcus versicolor]|uniref:AlgX/AlgJ SGNH hydrolase-like domain-containing protein n=1 Tax=Agrococcus versicolor TaxID=501482 RepID=A0ABP5MG54_9MICO